MENLKKTVEDLSRLIAKVHEDEDDKQKLEQFDIDGDLKKATEEVAPSRLSGDGR